MNGVNDGNTDGDLSDAHGDSSLVLQTIVIEPLFCCQWCCCYCCGSGGHCRYCDCCLSCFPSLITADNILKHKGKTEQIHHSDYPDGKERLLPPTSSSDQCYASHHSFERSSKRKESVHAHTVSFHNISPYCCWSLTMEKCE